MATGRGGSDFRGKEARKKPQYSANIKRSDIRAGKSKSDYTARKAQNKGVKDGTIRLGKSGKSYNVYDAKSATWKRGVVSTSKKPSTSGSRPTTRVSPSARGEGVSGFRMPMYSRGIGAGKAQTRVAANRLKQQTGRPTLRGALIAKKQTDTKNQYRDAAVIGSLPALAAGGAVGAGLGAIARAGTAAAAGARSGIAAGAGLAGRPAAARAAAARAAAKQPGTTKGVSKRTGGVLKDGKPATYGPKKPTAAQVAASRRSAAAKKAAATRKANARKRGK